jgi:hypothetical protein
MSNLTNSLKLFYRKICKEVRICNIKKYREYLNEEIAKYNHKDYDLNKLIELNTFIQEYKSMLQHISEENSLLKSYNINVRRDSKKKVESVANYVGLRI